jgi:hypothetical protein
MIGGFDPGAPTLDDVIEEVLLVTPPGSLVNEPDRREKGKFVSRKEARQGHGHWTMLWIVHAFRGERELCQLPRTACEALQPAFDVLEAGPFNPRGSRVKRPREQGGRWKIRFATWGGIFRGEGDQIRGLRVGRRSTLHRS